MNGHPSMPIPSSRSASRRSWRSACRLVFRSVSGYRRARRASPILPLAAPVVALTAALTAALGALSLAGCASPPIETDLPPSTLAPSEIAAAPAEASGQVLWGGELIGSSNLDDSTQLEVLAYPLDRRQRPMTGRPSEGRFLVRVDDYLETVDYADGRLVTVLGTLDGVRDGTIGEARLVYPMVRSEQLHLWSERAEAEGPRFGFGIGVNIGN